MLRDLLRAEGFRVGRKHITTLMRRIGIMALYRKPNTSNRAPGRTNYPYLLRTLAITRSNHVWAMDISYIPMARGFVYRAAVIDRHSRKVLAWRLPISMDCNGCWRDNMFVQKLWRSIKYEEVVCYERNRCVLDGSGALPKMRVGPSKSACRSRLQTATSCVG